MAAGSEAEGSGVAQGGLLLMVPGEAEGQGPLPAVRQVWGDQVLVGVLRWDSVGGIVGLSPELGAQTYLVTANGFVVSAEGVRSLLPGDAPLPAAGGTLPDGVARVLAGESGSGAYEDLEGVPVFGAYHWSPELGGGLLAEVPQDESLVAGDTLTAVVVGATLAVALMTAAIAAVVTRRITRPIVQLTETAAWMARGDLSQQVPVVRKDEIGVLARAFNRMAEELQVLYGNLEAKVNERTQQLEEANRHTGYYVMQLAISAEVARVASSIRDLDLLLHTVIKLIGQAFELHYASIYLLDESGEWAEWQVGSTRAVPDSRRVAVGGPTLVGRAAAEGVRLVRHYGEEGEGRTKGPVMCQMVVPLRLQERMLGVLDLQSADADVFGESDQLAYRSLADQISIAIENARAYALERETVRRLKELDRIQNRFLTNMSHALRTPLNSVIGFSRVMLKGLDGPLTDVQRDDLEAIHESGRQLLGLINDMLELSQLDLGVAPFSPAEVDLAEIAEGVLVTAKALARGKPVQIEEDIPADLPVLYTDGQRVRQVILALLSNAVKFTEEGRICLRISADRALEAAGPDQRVTISVSDTGTGIPEAAWGEIFADRRYTGAQTDGDVPGFGLVIGKRVVERLGGEIWVDSEEGVGSTFAFSLPIRPNGGQGKVLNGALSRGASKQ
jgi:signal transduction histidine kinase